MQPSPPRLCACIGGGVPNHQEHKEEKQKILVTLCWTIRFSGSGQKGQRDTHFATLSKATTKDFEYAANLAICLDEIFIQPLW